MTNLTWTLICRRKFNKTTREKKIIGVNIKFYIVVILKKKCGYNFQNFGKRLSCISSIKKSEAYMGKTKKKKLIPVRMKKYDGV